MGCAKYDTSLHLNEQHPKARYVFLYLPATAQTPHGVYQLQVWCESIDGAFLEHVQSIPFNKGSLKGRKLGAVLL